MSVIIVFIIIGLLLAFTAWRRVKQDEPSSEDEKLKEIMSTSIGHYKVQAALKQAQRLGVGVLTHEGKVYTVATKNSPDPGTEEFKNAYETAMKEKSFKTRSH